MNRLCFPSATELQIESLIGNTDTTASRNATVSVQRLLIELEGFREDVANVIVAVSDADQRRQLSLLHRATLAARTTLLCIAM